MNTSRNRLTVLCYGDSNTFGASTEDNPDGRYAPDERWTGVLQGTLGDGWNVIEEGLGGRTTNSDDPIDGADKNGQTYLRPCLMSHRPLDWVIIMLGTNDLKTYFDKSASEIADGVGTLVDDIQALRPGRDDGIPNVLVVAPPVTLDTADQWTGLFEGGSGKSRLFAVEYARIAKDRGTHFFDAGSVVQSSTVDAIHLDRSAHKRLGAALAEAIANLN